MTNVLNNDDAPLRHYLLGEMAPDEELVLEERLLVDNDYMELLEVVEDELIDDYARGGLTDAERASFETRFLCSDERRKKVRLARALDHYVEQTERTAAERAEDEPNLLRQAWQWLSSQLAPPILKAAAAFLVVGFGVTFWLLFFYQSEITKGLVALKAAYSEERPVESRISGFDYARYPSMRGAVATIKFDSLKRKLADNILHEQADKKKNATSFHALGKFYLTEKNPSEAVKYFELALKDDERNAKLHNDLAVALMEREKTRGPNEFTGEDNAKALEHLRRAIELDDSLLEAHFNLALCHQYQKLWRQAEEDWKKYLEKDSHSQWAEEARQNLKQVEERKQRVSQNREQLWRAFLTAYQNRDPDQAWQAYKHSRLNTGSFITQRLIDDYLALAFSGRQAEAADRLQALLFAGDVELQKVNDRFTYDLAHFYRSASPQQLQKVSQARGLVKSAYEHYGKSLLDEAINRYQQAKKLIDQAGNVCEATLTEYWLGHCYFRQLNAKQSLIVLEPGANNCKSRKYQWLFALFLNDLANISTLLTKYSKAIEYSSRSLSLTREIEDDHGALRGITQLADVYKNTNRHYESLLFAQQALNLADQTSASASQVAAIYFFAAWNYSFMNLSIAAIDHQEEALKLSQEMNNPLAVSRYYVQLGLMYEKIENYGEAVKMIQHSIEMGNKLHPDETGKEIVGYSLLYLGQIHRETNALTDSITDYDKVIQLYQEGEKPFLLFKARKGRLLTYLRQGNDVAVAQELKQVLDMYEQHRVNILEESNRSSFFDTEQDIYDLAIEFAYSRLHSSPKAFEYSEMCRARSLFNSANVPPEMLPEGDLPELRYQSTTQPLGLKSIQEQLPNQTQVLQFAALDNNLIFWVLSSTRVESRITNTGLKELDQKVTGYLHALSANTNNKSDDASAAARELYGLLIKPIEDLLDKDTRLCIVPDKSLNRLPFASLISPGTGKYLIEERAIFVSPSANMLVVSTDKAKQKEKVKSERLLSIGNPRFDKETFRSQKDLPWSAIEASEISAFYQAPTILVDRNAREVAVRREIERADVAHLAMHYVPDERTPLLSVLPLAEEQSPASKNSDGRLQTYELYQLNLSRLRLVVLSACQTGIEQYYKGEGAISLARSFQAAGIPLVVASLWPVESYPTKELMVSFHKHRQSGHGLPTVEALRRAQLEMLNSPEPQLRNPYHWAAFAVIGGYANF